MLRTASVASGVRVGCAIGNAYWNDNQCMQLIKDNCNCYANENAFKWGEMEKSQGHVNWEYVDKLVELAEMHNGLVKLHSLFSHEQQPGWIYGLSADALEAAMRDRIRYTAAKFKGREYLLYGIDVVTEAIDDSTGQLRDSLYSQRLGGDWVIKAYQMAREAFGSSVMLIYNDCGMELAPKNSGVFELVKELRRMELVDEIGFQTHIVESNTLESFDAYKSALRSYADLGMRVNISKLDIRMNHGTRPGIDVLNKQGEYAHQIVKCLLDCGAARSITTCGITDRYSWMSGDAPLPFDRNYNAKPFKRGIEKALNELQHDAVESKSSFELDSSRQSTVVKLDEQYMKLIEDDDDMSGDICGKWFWSSSEQSAGAQGSCVVL